MLEYWEPEEPFDLPKNVNFEYKAETDLYDFKKVSKRGIFLYGKSFSIVFIDIRISSPSQFLRPLYCRMMA
jgi:hypothetical protein